MDLAQVVAPVHPPRPLHLSAGDGEGLVPQRAEAHVGALAEQDPEGERPRARVRRGHIREARRERIGLRRRFGVEDGTRRFPIAEERAHGIAQGQRERLPVVLHRVVDERHRDGLGGLARREGQRAARVVVVCPRRRCAVRRRVVHRDRPVCRRVERHPEPDGAVGLVRARVGHRQPRQGGGRYGGLANGGAVHGVGRAHGRTVNPQERLAGRQPLVADHIEGVGERNVVVTLVVVVAGGGRVLDRVPVAPPQRVAEHGLQVTEPPGRVTPATLYRNRVSVRLARQRRAVDCDVVPGDLDVPGAVALGEHAGCAQLPFGQPRLRLQAQRDGLPWVPREAGIAPASKAGRKAVLLEVCVTESERSSVNHEREVVLGGTCEGGLDFNRKHARPRG